MRIPTLVRALACCAALAGLAGTSPCAAATGSWSPHSTAAAGFTWTRAGWIRIASARAEIAPAAPVRQRATPPSARARSPQSSNQCFSESRPDRHSPSRDRVQLARAALARLRTTAAPDRRARFAILSALAGIFHEAHAPPSRS